MGHSKHINSNLSQFESLGLFCMNFSDFVQSRLRFFIFRLLQSLCIILNNYLILWAFQVELAH